jgi:hypothetical protein
MGEEETRLWIGGKGLKDASPQESIAAEPVVFRWSPVHQPCSGSRGRARGASVKNSV